MTDAEWKELSSRSPEEAHRLLFDTYFRYVYMIVFRKLQGIASPEDVEECVSDVFAEIFRSYEGNSARNGDLKGYIGTIASRKAVDMFRSLSKRAGKMVSLEELSEQDAGTDLVRNAERSERSRLVLQAVKELGEPDASIILQRYYFGYSSKEIAVSLSMTAVAVRMRCSRALKRLRKRLTELGIDGQEV